ncbi:MAG: hypothetical protein IPJ88_11560 [Myxococcales bacterium]|nr:MAG: hypothetical protein IPJ88_11560 [Myxococcales bacterium]
MKRCFVVFFVSIVSLLVGCGASVSKEEGVLADSEASIAEELRQQEAADFFRNDPVVQILLNSYTRDFECDFNLKVPESVLTQIVEENGERSIAVMTIGLCNRTDGPKQVAMVQAQVLNSFKSFGTRKLHFGSLQGYRGSFDLNTIYFREYSFTENRLFAELPLSGEEADLFGELAAPVANAKNSGSCVQDLQSFLSEEGEGWQNAERISPPLSLSSESWVAVALGSMAAWLSTNSFLYVDLNKELWIESLPMQVKDFIYQAGMLSLLAVKYPLLGGAFMLYFASAALVIDILWTYGGEALENKTEQIQEFAQLWCHS